MFKWLFVSDAAKKGGPKPAARRPAKTAAKGTVTFDGRGFPLLEWNRKGFILGDYTVDHLIRGQRFTCEFKAAGPDGKEFGGKAECIVTRIVDGKLAAGFSLAFFDFPKGG